MSNASRTERNPAPDSFGGVSEEKTEQTGQARVPRSVSEPAGALAQLKLALEAEYARAARHRDKARGVLDGYNPLELARRTGYVQGLGAARRIVEELCR